MADIFREVDEELRHERYSKLWRKYGPYVIGMAVLIVVTVAGYVGWADYSETRRLRQGALFAEAVALAEQGKETDAAAAFRALAEDAGAGYRGVARLREAALLAEAGNAAGAVAVYDVIAGDRDLPVEFRELATLLAVLQSLDSGDPAALSTRLAALAGDSSPWRHSARELLAILAQRSGDTTRARELFTSLTDDTAAPSGVRARSAEALSGLGQ